MNVRKTSESITTTIEGVSRNEQQAVEDLWVFLNRKKVCDQLKYKGLGQEAGDIFFMAFEAFCRVIQNGRFIPNGDT